MIEHPSGLNQNSVFAMEHCPHCETRVWHKIAFIGPNCWTEDRFLELYDVNPDSKAVSLKKPKRIETIGSQLIESTISLDSAPEKRGRGRPKKVQDQ